jgi:UDP:flavonoid glycosyltransferase YjiC (YdhE family)
MRIAFSANPLPGHIVPMIPLLRAAIRAGHTVALLTSAEAAPFVRAEADPRVAVLAAGPATLAAMGDMARATGASPFTDPRPPVIADYFAGHRVDASLDDAIAAAYGWRPDVVVSESLDHVGPLVASVLGVPFVRHTLGPERPEAIRAAMAAALARTATAHGVLVPPVAAWIDAYPAFLEDPSATRPGRRVPIRPEPHSAAGGPDRTGALALGRFRPTVLLTTGTVFTDGDLVDRTLASVAATGIPMRVLTTSLPGTAPRPSTRVGDLRVVDVAFRPLAELLPEVDAVITVGGAGTVLGALTAGVPMVVMPRGADHEVNAARAVAAGAARRVDGPDDVGAALREVLEGDRETRAARSIAARIRELPPVSTALDALEEVVASARLSAAGISGGSRRPWSGSATETAPTVPIPRPR